MFDAISGRYDLINNVLSLGLDRYWRKAVCKHLPNKERIKLLDCATGTGDLLASLLKNCPTIYDSVGMDPAQKMLDLAAPKLARDCHRAHLVCAPAEAIPFPDNMFDVATIAFGIRTVADVSPSLKEIHRTLLPQGRLVILEFSHPEQRVVRFLHRFYLNRVVPCVGKWLSGNKDAYTYLAKTVEAFPQGKAFGAILEEAGFVSVRIQPLSLGIVSLYVGEKG
jgi:demethylmenaquinone methyltransferase/2-methoxy-6-polyprenyl-1,4-benzoquinol methylase